MIFRLVLRRLLAAVPVGVAAAVMAFTVFALVPGDPVTMMLGERANDRALVAKLRGELGLDAPFVTRLARFGAGVARGDLGRSHRTGAEIAADLRRAVPASAELAAAALLVSLALGLSAGLAAGFRPGGWLDRALMPLCVAGASIPVYWLALALGWLLASRFPVFELAGRLGGDLAAYEPRSGFVTLDAAWYRDGPMMLDGLRHLALPALTLGLFGSALTARTARGAILEARRADCLRTARAKGLPPWRVAVHALRLAAPAVATAAGLHFAALLGGAIMTEEIFAWPGLGTYLVQAIRYRDLPAAQGAVLAGAMLAVLANLATDLTVLAADPRARAAN